MSPQESPAPLVTTLLPPRLPPGHVRRPRLIERLEQGTARPLTLICGPPGSGKTSLLCSWLQERSGAARVAWVSLDQSSDDPAVLWGAVLAALRGDSAVPAIAPPVRGSRLTFMPRLVNELAALPETAILVLDDVHVLRSRECLAQLSFLTLHLPPTLRIVLSSRAEPPLPLHVSRVLGTLTEIRASDLAFTGSEATELLAAHGLPLGDAQVAALCARTEGWAAGLRLAALGLEGCDDPERFLAEFDGDDRVVADYLLAEVLDHLPPRRRAFLLRTSISDRVTGALADAITGETTGAETLADLQRTNGFVVGLDHRDEWYRYHALFARLLELRARRELGAEMPTLHARAARWHAGEGEIWPALRHSVAGEDWELAARLTVAHGVELLVGGQGGSLGALVAQFPPEWVERDPELSAIVACSLLEAGDAAAAAPHLEAAAGLVAPDRQRALAETRAVARLYLARLRGDVRDALANADELLAASPERSGPAGASRQALVCSNLGRTALWAGDVERAASLLKDAVAIGRAGGLDYLLVGTLGQLALLELARGGPDDALPLAGEALDLASRRGWAGIPETAPAQLAAAAAALYGHRPDAATHLEAARMALAGSGEVHLHAVANHLGALLAAADGDVERGLAQLAPAAIPGWGLADPGLMEVTRARLYIELGDLDGAEDALRRVESAPAGALECGSALLQLATGDPYAALASVADVRAELACTRVELLLVKTLALEALERTDARPALEATLAAAETTGTRSPLLEACPRSILRTAIRHGTQHRALVGELLDVLDDRQPIVVTAGMALDPLTDREQSVLRYLPSTLSNREIAGELLVSTNTLKTHVRAIYRKLGVPDRRAAVERAKALGLLREVIRSG
jgi:LuxR family maltose regulon positive regulatory protein